MPTRSQMAFMVACAASMSALAQNQTSKYRFYSSAYSLVPGQSASVRIEVDMNPDIGTLTPGGTILGLASGAFNLVATGMGSGTWSNLVLDAPYNGPGGSSGTAAGANVNGVSWATAPLLSPPHPSPVNGDIVWTATFTAGMTAGPVSFTILPSSGVKVWVLPSPLAPPAEASFQAAFGDPPVINVLPAPGSGAVVLMGALFAGRRRRAAS